MSIFDQNTDIKFSNFFNSTDKFFLTAGFRDREYNLLIKYFDNLGEEFVFEINKALKNWVQENKEKIHAPDFKNAPFYKYTIEHPFEVFDSQVIAPPVHLYFETCSSGTVRLDVMDGRNVLIGVLKFNCWDYMNPL